MRSLQQSEVAGLLDGDLGLTILPGQRGGHKEGT